MTTVEVVTILIAASGPLTGGIWYLQSLSGDKRTRKIVGEVIGPLIDAKLSQFKLDLNGPTGYRRSESCELMMKPHGDQLVRIEGDLRSLRSHVHRLDTKMAEGD